MTAIQSTGDIKKGNQPITTSYYGVGGDASLVQHIHLKWDATFVGVFTFWTCDFSEIPVDYAADDGTWTHENPPTGYTAVSPPAAGTAATPLVVQVAGGTAGGASVHVGNLGSERLRVRVVCTTAGVIRIRAHGKE